MDLWCIPSDFLQHAWSWCVERHGGIFLTSFDLRIEMRCLFKAHNGHTLICENSWVSSLFIIKMHLYSHLRWVLRENIWAELYSERTKITLRTRPAPEDLLPVMHDFYQLLIYLHFLDFVIFFKYISLKVIKKLPSCVWQISCCSDISDILTFEQCF